MKFILLINVKMPAIVCVLRFDSESKKKIFFSVPFFLLAIEIPCSVELSMKKVLEPRGYNAGCIDPFECCVHIVCKSVH